MNIILISNPCDLLRTVRDLCWLGVEPCRVHNRNNLKGLFDGLLILYLFKGTVWCATVQFLGLHIFVIGYSFLKFIIMYYFYLLLQWVTSMGYFDGLCWWVANLLLNFWDYCDRLTIRLWMVTNLNFILLSYLNLVYNF